MVKMKPMQRIYARFSDFEFLGFRRSQTDATENLKRRRCRSLRPGNLPSLLCKGLLLRRLGLLVNVGVTAVIVALEIGGRGFAAQVAVDALVIDIEFAG